MTVTDSSPPPPGRDSLTDDLLWRGLIQDSTDLDELRELLDGGTAATYYVGFDPTAPSLHVGNLMQVLMARRLQLAGHRPLLLVGGATGQIGDPKESAERTLNPPDVIAGWVERIREQLAPFVSYTGDNAAQLVNNLDWTGEMSVVEFLRDVGKHFPVNKMLAREVVRARLETGISFTEFSYQLLQANDFFELHRRHGCSSSSAAPTSGATSPPASTTSAGAAPGRCTRSPRRWSPRPTARSSARARAAPSGSTPR